jgi:hypothetical protein
VGRALPDFAVLGRLLGESLAGRRGGAPDRLQAGAVVVVQEENGAGEVPTREGRPIAVSSGSVLLGGRVLG